MWIAGRQKKFKKKVFFYFLLITDVRVLQMILSLPHMVKHLFGNGFFFLLLFAQINSSTGIKRALFKKYVFIHSTNPISDFKRLVDPTVCETRAGFEIII